MSETVQHYNPYLMKIADKMPVTGKIYDTDYTRAPGEEWMRLERQIPDDAEFEGNVAQIVCAACMLNDLCTGLIRRKRTSDEYIAEIKLRTDFYDPRSSVVQYDESSQRLVEVKAWFGKPTDPVKVKGQSLCRVSELNYNSLEASTKNRLREDFVRSGTT